MNDVASIDGVTRGILRRERKMPETGTPTESTVVIEPGTNEEKPGSTVPGTAPAAQGTVDVGNRTAAGSGNGAGSTTAVPLGDADDTPVNHPADPPVAAAITKAAQAGGGAGGGAPAEEDANPAGGAPAAAVVPEGGAPKAAGVPEEEASDAAVVPAAEDAAPGGGAPAAPVEGGEPAAEGAGAGNVDAVVAAASQRGDASNHGGSGNADHHDAQLTRFEVLKRKLVDEHKAAKDARADEEKEDAGSIRHTGRVAHNQRADLAADMIGYIGLLGTGGAAAVPPITQFGAKIFGNSDLSETIGNSQDRSKSQETLTDDEQKWQDGINWLGLAGNAVGALSGGVKGFSNVVRRKTDKSKYRRKTAKYRALAGFSSMVGSLAAGYSNAENLGLIDGRATQFGTGARSRGAVADIIAGLSGILDKTSDYVGNLEESEGHAAAAKDSRAYYDRKKDSAEDMLEQSQDDLRRARVIPDGQTEQQKAARKLSLKDARMRRNTAKAQKYAMAQAADFHEARVTNQLKGFFGMIGSVSSGLGTMLTAMAKRGGWNSTAGALGTVLSGIGGLAKAANTGADQVINRKELNRLRGKRDEVVDEYLTAKARKIKDEAANVGLDDAEKAAVGEATLNLTDSEAKNVAIMRLGINLPDETRDIKKLESKVEVFKKITEKRAKNILLSDPAEKKKMLDALGLDEDAALEDVERALSGDWDPSVTAPQHATVRLKQKIRPTRLGQKLSGVMSHFRD